ncbi:tetratricopeptide repeat protein [Thiothrix subterranea]|uniref:Tetratricopeptide repeat protein n=1 Tax=Thiothrix subterranea TaxID=2735563 RepID=A0AA51MMN1_9GAMM|nr:tetratricopeptide repeat protein [Thiothrix subterranea]MDQ5770299.1 tetratricopeptide repeat protein [Thiothrix subterranea]WML85841.1 tetratricopeptide repeat protein [Thiothrix subterranea]
MRTIKVQRWTYSLFTSPLLLLGMASAALPLAANPQIEPSQSVHMNEAPPPWNGNIPASATAPPAGESSKGSSVENWYRNRRKTDANMGGELATLKTAAESGDAKAQYKLAMLYRNEENPQADIKQSLTWQQRAAQAGYMEAQYGLGLLYANGQYVPADDQQARHWFDQAASQGHVAARLALLSLDNGAPAQALATSNNLKMQEQQPPALMPKIPVVNPASRPQPVSTPVSLPMMAQPADQGDDAPNKLDLTGIEPDVLRQSAESGDKQAQLMLGTLYEDGLGGLPADLREAAYWYEQAAKQHYPKAQYNLGLLYEDGRGVTQNDKQAAYWYDKAAKAGFTEAQNNLGVLFVLGKGVKKDSKKAEKLFTDAASKGNADAQRNLDMLRKG